MKTTARDFRIFRSECERLVKSWGLTGWNIRCEHGTGSVACRAQYTCDISNRVLWLRLSCDWDVVPMRALLIEAARHEVAHGVLGPLDCLNENRFVTRDEHNAAVHEVVHHLVRLLP
jgi:hypothetical protein